jgi:hypothetical protein
MIDISNKCKRCLYFDRLTNDSGLCDKDIEEHDQEIAQKAFEKWKIENPCWFKQLSIEEIIIDTIRTKEKSSVTRYRVKKKFE